MRWARAHPFFRLFCFAQIYLLFSVRHCVVFISASLSAARSAVIEISFFVWLRERENNKWAMWMFYFVFFLFKFGLQIFEIGTIWPKIVCSQHFWYLQKRAHARSRGRVFFVYNEVINVINEKKNLSISWHRLGYKLKTRHGLTREKQIFQAL